MDKDQKIFIEKLKIPFELFNSQYDLNDLIFKSYEGKLPITYKRQMLLEYLASIQNNLYSIGELIIIGYPMQAGIIASTVYEEVQYAIHFYFNDNALKDYILDGHKDFNIEVGKIIKKNISDITKDNVEKLNISRSWEDFYKIYKIFCRFKHPHPSFKRLLQDKNTKEISSFIGSRLDEQALGFSFYILHNAANLASIVSLLAIQDIDELGKDALILMKKYYQLIDLTIRTENFVKENYPNWSIDPFSISKV